MFSDEEQFRELVRRLKIDERPRSGHRHDLWQEMLAAFEARPAEGERPWLGARAIHAIRLRRVALSRIAVAAAALVFLGVGAWIFLTTESVALASASFADVLEQVRKARTVSYQLSVQLKGRVDASFRVMVAEPGRIRLSTPDGRAQIIDLRTGKILTLGAVAKVAAFVKQQGIGEREDYDPLEKLRKLHESAGTFVGQQKLDGRTVNVFRADRDPGTMTVWVHPKTNLPIRVEIVTPWQDKAAQPSDKVITVMSDMVWDADLPESLFSLVPPKGYLLEDEYYANSTEMDLIKLLRLCAELSDGTFPDKLDLGTAALIATRHATDVLGVPPVKVEVPDGSQWTVVRRTRRVKRFYEATMRGLAFVRRLVKDGSDWTYRGKSVQLGDSQRPVCWWRPKGSDTCRVVFGDLTVKNLPPDELPKPDESGQ